MIVFENVTKKFGDSEPVLDKVNFLIDRGSFVYLVGPTGSGKTTIFRLIIRDLLPSEGKINIGEWDLVSLPKAQVPHLRRKVGVVFQDLKLLMDRTVLENVMLPLQFSGTDEGEAQRRAEEALNDVGLGEKIDKFPLQLSGGERQRVAIARALVFNPEVILADEPTGNLDTQTSFQILDLLKSINKRGTTIFMATHNDVLINNGADRVIVLEKGQLKDNKKVSAKHTGEDKKKESKAKSDDEEKKVVEEKSVKPVSSESKDEKKMSAKDDEDEEDPSVSESGKIKLETLAKK